MLKNNHNLKFLIVGTGRCGTVYMARLLSSLNLMCGHESVFTPKGFDHAKNILEGVAIFGTSYLSLNNYSAGKSDKSWFDYKKIIADSSLYAVPFLQEKIMSKIKILHLVRNPISVVRSFAYDTDVFHHDTKHRDCSGRNFIYNHLPELKNIDTVVDRVVYYYVEWNKKIIESNRAILVHQVENGLNDKLCDFLGIVKPNNFYDDKKANSYDKHKKILNICDISNGLLKDKFLNLSEKFGYKINYKNEIFL